MAPGVTWLGDTELDTGSFDDLKNIANNSLLLIHDPADDDLNYQYSLRMQQILNGNGVLFDEWVLAGEGPFMQLELYETMDNFWINCFNL
ncbi:venom dipeptidyl peptidase 4-like [Musca domestica]|uniref:Venom dipeptidyl peptidase 4-like n=1 Tax=Musca domestica TaxID=7370 RepID=A0ABM3VIP3_MUSDO|nr:venom dipeptidyl peptidase 4-like [Musca domestica]